MARYLIPSTCLVLVLIVSLIAFSAPPPTTLPPGNHYFTADWCPACQTQDKIIKNLQKQGYTIKIYEDPKIFDELNIKTIPTIIIVKINEKGKKIILKLEGIQPIKKLIKLLDKQPIRKLIESFVQEEEQRIRDLIKSIIKESKGGEEKMD